MKNCQTWVRRARIEGAGPSATWAAFVLRDDADSATKNARGGAEIWIKLDMGNLAFFSTPQLGMRSSLPSRIVLPHRLTPNISETTQLISLLCLQLKASHYLIGKINPTRKFSIVFWLAFNFTSQVRSSLTFCRLYRAKHFFKHAVERKYISGLPYTLHVILKHVCMT